MRLTFGSNIASLGAQRKLSEQSAALSKSFLRLSTGMRINSAADDAAGLSVSSKLQANAKIYGQAIRNVNDGVSALMIADGALGELSNITIRLKELATQSANGPLNRTQRRAIDKEGRELVDEFNRIVGSTAFNGRSLLTGETTSIDLQLGFSSVQFGLGDKLSRRVGDGTFQDGFYTANGGNYSASFDQADFNNDGILDLVSFGDYATVYLGTASGGLTQVGNYSGFETLGRLADINNDGRPDLVGLNGGELYYRLNTGGASFGTHTAAGSIGSYITSFDVADMNGDGLNDLVVAGSVVQVLNGLSSGGFSTTGSPLYSGDTGGIRIGDMNGDGFLDIVSSTIGQGTDNLLTFLGNGRGSYSTNTYALGGFAGIHDIELADLNNDGALDVVGAQSDTSRLAVLIGAGNGSYSSLTTFARSGAQGVNIGDINGDGFVDVGLNTGSATEVFLGSESGALTFLSSESHGSLFKSAFFDVNNDGALDILTSSVGSGFHVNLANAKTTTSIARENLSLVSGARAALGTLDKILQRISSERGSIGASLSRLQVGLSTLAASKENSEAARGRIVDADVASESSQLVRLKILQEASAAVLAQANQVPALAITLLR